MIKTTPHILTEEQDKRETIHCIIWASVVVFVMLAFLLHGLAFLSWTEPTMEEIYARRMMDNSIKTLRQDFENHRHHFWTGKIKQEMAK